MQAQADTRSTGVFHDGDEVAVRASSRYSRKFHEPKTDDAGDVIFVDGDGDRVDADHDDAHPLPACGKDARDGTAWKLVPLLSVDRRDPCKNCSEDDETISERNATGSGNITLARLAQRSDWKGGETLSGNASHSN